jgi:hypothetical protein
MRFAILIDSAIIPPLFPAAATNSNPLVPSFASFNDALFAKIEKAGASLIGNIHRIVASFST